MAPNLALDPKAAAALALHRFGVGPRAGSIAAIASDPRGALLSELDRPDAGRIPEQDLLTSGAAARAAFDFQRAQRAARQAERAAREPNPPSAGSGGSAPAPSQDMANPAGQPGAPPAPRPNAGPGVPQQIYLDEAKARIHAALGAELGFVERLAWFWSNHFCVSADKGGVRPICGAYEREAIRAHMLGRFGDMLLAVESHPAMLIYLDNARSIGPDSIAGVRQKRGLNENLAREILELHTLGVRSVYSQEDVTRFANVITGWTVVAPRQDAARAALASEASGQRGNSIVRAPDARPEPGSSARAGEFDFNPRMHQPGAQTVLGRSYPDTGVEQGRAVLAALARHPATAKHVATKLVRHFVADEPPPVLVERLAKRFLATQGDLKELAKALVTAPEAWEAPRTKLKRPGEWIVGALRAIDVQPAGSPDARTRYLGALARTPSDVQPVMQAKNLLGEPLWRPSAPKGFADESAPWLDGLAQRLDIANQLVRRLGGPADPREALEETLGPLASTETRRAIMRAESRPQALALLLMAPEFQRR